MCDLGTLVEESRVKTEPGRPHVLLLPGQRGRQSGASGASCGLDVTERSLQNKTNHHSDLYSL